MKDGDNDQLTRFWLEHAGVRGVHVRLRDTWAQVRSRADYPPVAAELLGEALAAAALFTGHAKIDGRLSIQLRGQGALRTLFAECTAAGTLRGIVQLGDEAATLSRDLRELGADAMLAITIENPGSGGREPLRYQGVVALDSDALGEAFEQYFRQSEQLPTRLLLGADGSTCAGLMLQKLPGDSGDDDGWNRACALFDTLGARELADSDAAVLLHRLFHDEDLRLLGGKPLSFACSCSRERVGAMLQSLGEAEASAAVIDGVAQVRCEFCGQRYRFDRPQIDALFTQQKRSMSAPERLQ